FVLPNSVLLNVSHSYIGFSGGRWVLLPACPASPFTRWTVVGNHRTERGRPGSETVAQALAPQLRRSEGWTRHPGSALLSARRSPPVRGENGYGVCVSHQAGRRACGGQRHHFLSLARASAPPGTQRW